MATHAPSAGSRSRTGLARGIWALGFVSMFMDISSEMIHALLPIYLVTALGASTLTVGFIEGIAEATANITKIFSGALSDWRQEPWLTPGEIRRGTEGPGGCCRTRTCDIRRVKATLYQLS